MSSSLNIKKKLQIEKKYIIVWSMAIKQEYADKFERY